MSLSLSASGTEINSNGNGIDSGSSDSKFPHTKAQLSLIARQSKSSDNYDSDAEGDDQNRVSSNLASKVVFYLDNELEDDLKKLLKDSFGLDDETLEQSVLDLMHKHRDDVAGVPFLFLTPTRRPISRPSSRASSHSTRLYPARPDTPTSAPTSPLAMVFRRPHTPVTSPLAGGTNGQPSSYMSARSLEGYSPHSSPVLAHAQATQAHAQYTASLPASPLSSPRLLNAKASEFKPIQRPLSAASFIPGFSHSAQRSDTPSPDLWAHNSPRATSNLAIAAPLIPEQSNSSSSLRSSLQPEDDDDDIDFDPFSNKDITPFPITVSDFDTPWSTTNSNASMSPEDYRYFDALGYQHPYYTDIDPQSPPESNDPDSENFMLTDGMTPFDVLSSVFGSTLAPSELEDALANNGYDFERSMAWLIDRSLPVTTQGHQVRVQQMGGRVTVVSRDGQNGQGNIPIRGGRAGYNNTSPPGRPGARYVNGRPVQGGNRVCRYFVAGECLRADCRFSHDLERALCRFWLRGTCAKNESCEFLHHLPKDVDINSLNAAVARAHIGPGQGPLAPAHAAPIDEFPVLNYEGGDGRARRGGGGGYYDPSRTRFSAAVKKPAAESPASVAARREVMGSNADALHNITAIIAPRASPRLKLHPPTLLPTLSTGEALNALYMSYRSRALQLGAARNACLSRAAAAWRRGDGASAKRFSREGHELNAKMSTEMADAAGKLVRERAKTAEQAVRARDVAWSDDPGDRASRGRPCGGGLGICLGIARRDTGDGKLTSEERTECVLDLHGLHSNEATEVLEQFLMSLEREHFYGLAYIVVGEEKHTGTQDAARGASRLRLATGVREWLHRWGYPWSERDGIIAVDALTHASE
ncbi:hypothetical protein EYR38_008966 [Pleurotus pulmonarius]|nr:hypothetical protein EYR38_008966 [Pleurotus pulmonarius]